MNELVEFWSKDVSFNQLQKFWNELSQQARQELLRVDKQTFFKQARKNMFCSRCHGFLVEEFSQIVVYGKSSQLEGSVGHLSCNRLEITKFQNVGGLSNATGCQSDDQDPSIHPWGCLTTTRNGTLTLLDCYLLSTSVKGIQNVFDNSRARERERKLHNPNACGVGGRRWKGPGTRETCAVHTARLPLERLVDFWSALGEESRHSLLKMKEEDFIERLVYRFDKKKFCKDCRKNVVREFKELKELKRIRKEAGLQYEISHDTVQADWSHTFVDTYGTYHHFEWGIGSEKGKSDISAFKNVGLSGIVQVNGLDLSGFDAFYITLKAWKQDGDCTEFSVKAHTLKGQQCVHRRLVVGDGFVTITEGESIQNFFKHAEEVVKEDDDLVDEDGNRLDGECSRPQKHAKSPELAQEFLLDAATVIFKEQVEKAFRERTARQNAHSVFVSLALKLLEERTHVACKEILTLEKQMKLLEEEVKEKNEDEERKERRRIKEREKKLRRKERTRENEKDKDNCSLTNQHLAPEVRTEESTIVDEDPDAIETGKVMSSRPVSPHIQDEQQINGYISKNMHNLSDVSPDGNFSDSKDKNGSSGYDYSKYSGRKLKNRYQHDTTLKCSINRRFAVPKSGIMVNKSEQSYHDDHYDSSSRSTSELNKNSRSCAAKSIIRAGGPKLREKSHCSNRMSDFHARSCYQHSDYRGKVESYCMTTRAGQESVCEPHSASLDMSKPSYCGKNKFTLGDYIHNNCGRPKHNFVAGNIPSSRDLPQTKQVGEPMESQMKYIQSYSESDDSVRLSTLSGDAWEPYKSLKSPGALCHDVGGQKTVGIKDEHDVKKELKLCEPRIGNNGHSGFHLDEETCQYFKEVADVEVEMYSYLIWPRDPSVNSISSSNSCSSCLSEGDSSESSTNPQIIGPLSTSDSEDVSQQSEGREASQRLQIGVHKCEEVVFDKKQIANGGEPIISCSLDRRRIYALAKEPKENGNGNPDVNHMNLQAQGIHPPLHSHSMQRDIPMKQDPTPTQPNAAGEKNLNSDISQAEDRDFSLFYFGGPFALADAYKSDSLPSEDAVGGLSPIKSIHRYEDDLTCNKKDTIEEYNLFASCKGITFSIF